jgi:hypothetical protein
VLAEKFPGKEIKQQVKMYNEKAGSEGWRKCMRKRE